MIRHLNELELTGRTRTHVEQFHEPRFAAQAEAAEAFLSMRADALTAGVELVPFSTFRDFPAQLKIWNAKFSRTKPLYDIDGNLRDSSSMSSNQLISCILNWSAVPGGSRHHWGTEIDVVDGLAMKPGYRPKLLPEEVAPGGIFFPLHAWLDENIGKYNFFRPYKRSLGGIYPEPWHLSYAPQSMPAVGQLSIDLLTRVLKESDILEKDAVLERIPEIYRDQILNFVTPADQ